MIDERTHDRAKRLSSKHNIPFEDALEVLMFFRNFNLHSEYVHAEMLIMSAKQWGIRPVSLINFGLENCFAKIREQ